MFTERGDLLVFPLLSVILPNHAFESAFSPSSSFGFFLNFALNASLSFFYFSFNFFNFAYNFSRSSAFSKSSSQLFGTLSGQQIQRNLTKRSLWVYVVHKKPSIAPQGKQQMHIGMHAIKMNREMIYGSLSCLDS